MRMSKPDSQPRICDYEGSNYRTDFWEGRGREYEDRVERIALRKLLPKTGQRLLEVGAGFGRLTNEYANFEQVIVLDYALSNLQDAQEHLGRSPRYIYVAADAYKLPFQPGIFDCVTVVRVLHHMSDVTRVLSQIRRVMSPGGTLILEHANKRNLKAMVRHALNKQAWDPNNLDPVEFVELNFDFHPEHIRQELGRAGFDLKTRVPVSFFRLQSLKKYVPQNVLVGMDSALQATGLLYSPSIFTKSIATGPTPDNRSVETLFACPECGGEVVRSGEILTCRTDGRRWAVRDGIYDFKAPIEVD